MDDPIKQKRILETLTQTVGEGNFNFVLLGHMGESAALPHFDADLLETEHEDDAMTVEGTVTSQRIDAAE
jgi:hypothetical protein